ncbi:DUF2254 family protein [Fulvivirga sp.]|uniref:DUF2254 domain-containing protein n=1 Tax=Fulvivirga sp. TaxID=1931237 RepID=UPI0032EEF7EF
MKVALAKFLRLYRLLISNLAFIPTIITVGSLMLAIGMLYIESHNYTSWLEENIDFALVKGTENARMVLTTIIGGVLSLTVFSFSMVMVVLNRATASLSPRVLPQLIAQKSHQVVLGYNMGTIVYSLILIINIKKDTGIPSFGILLAMLATIGSLGLFIYFIHSISQSIQVGNILHNIYKETIAYINNKKSKKHIELLPDIDWYTQVKAKKAGYYNFEVTQELLNQLEKTQTTLLINVYPEQFVLSGQSIAYTDNQQLSSTDKKICEACFKVSESPKDSNNFILSIQKISEIAVKALSPGINDPGTAIRALRVLTMLVPELMPHTSNYSLLYKEKKVEIIYTAPDIETILLQYIAPIMDFGNGQLSVTLALFDFYIELITAADLKNRETIERYSQGLIENCKNHNYLKVENDLIEKHVLKLTEYQSAN